MNTIKKYSDIRSRVADYSSITRTSVHDKQSPVNDWDTWKPIDPSDVAITTTPRQLADDITVLGY